MGRDTGSLPDQALMLGIGVTQRVISGAMLAVIVTHESHHQVAAVDIERSAGDVTGGLGSGKANQIGDFKSGAEAWHRITRGESLEQVVRGMFARQFGIDHALGK